MEKDLAKIAKEKGFLLLLSDSLEKEGYFLVLNGKKYIFINSNLSKEKQEYTFLHELKHLENGHDELESLYNQPYKRIIEREADTQAINELIADYVLNTPLEYCNYLKFMSHYDISSKHEYYIKEQMEKHCMKKAKSE